MTRADVSAARALIQPPLTEGEAERLAVAATKSHLERASSQSSSFADRLFAYRKSEAKPRIVTVDIR